MNCFALKNVASVGTTVVTEPWKHPARNRYPALVVAKGQWSQWINDPGTDHCFLSMVEGLSASVRVSDDNPAFKVHGFLVDCDSEFTPAAKDSLFQRSSEWAPAYAARTFSGNARLAYVFEKPVLVAGNKHYAAFAKVAARQMKLIKTLAGFEEEAIVTATKYYDIGREWFPIYKDAVIPENIVNMWVSKAGDKINFAPQEYRIPLDLVQQEIDKRWPGRWVGSFEVGARSVRFWDSSADNTTAAVLRESGFQCFTGPVPFVSWRDLLGSQFCQKFEASRIGDIEGKSAYEEPYYWYFHEAENIWIPRNRADHAQFLRVCGFDGDKAKGDTMSEIDRIQTSINTRRRVYKATPIPHYQSGIIEWNGKTYLNTCLTKCLTPIGELAMVPNPTFDSLKERAPFIHAFFEHLFDGQNEQLWHFLGWVKYFYENGLALRPKPGHAVLLAGPPSAGKTFLAQAILSPLVGGRSMAGSHLLGSTRWTDAISSQPLALVDDEVTGTDSKQIQEFTTRIKAFVATSEILCAGKYKDERTVPFFGRVLILTNVDPHSLSRCMPDLSLSTRDKFMLFKTTDKRFPLFTTREKHAEIISSELSYFAQWLLDWEFPSSIIDPENLRFGIRAYHHPDLMNESRKQGNDEIVWGLVRRMILQCTLENRKQGVEAKARWVGDITKLYGDLHATSPHAMRDIKIRSLQLTMQSLERRGGHDIKRISENGVELWDIFLGDDVVRTK